MNCYVFPSTILSLQAAKDIAANLTTQLDEVEHVHARDAKGRILACNMLSTLPLPPFDQSAMDGIAINTSDLLETDATRLLVRSQVFAGDRYVASHEQGSAVRVFTGAQMPSGTNAVVMQEHCTFDGSNVVVPASIKPGDNIRRKGEDIAIGSPMLSSGTKLDARHVAMMCATGVTHIPVIRKLRVTAFTTGSELIEPGQALVQGQIFDSNRFMLLSLLSRSAIELTDGGRLQDDLELMSGRFAEASRSSDLIVASGGAGGSDADFMLEAVRKAGGEASPLRVALKPGKPSVMGTINTCAMLGLPGNPVAALVNFLLFGETLIRRRTGCAAPDLQGLPAISASRFRHTPGKTEFVPTRLAPSNSHNLCLEILGRGGSARLSPLLAADGLAEIASEQDHIEPGSPLRFYPFSSLAWI